MRNTDKNQGDMVRSLPMYKFSIILTFLSLLGCSSYGLANPEKVLYEELTPKEFRERISAAPIAYLPLGTIEWHGEHLPLGSDGLQSKHFFESLAKEAGGIVLPMLFLGPDGHEIHEGFDYYGMDCGNFVEGEQYQYPRQQLAGSAYWVPDSTFGVIVEATLLQLKRAGFKIVVMHGHGPSTLYTLKHFDEWEEKYGMRFFNCWGDQDEEGMGIMVDHAAMNETSLVMAMRPELVQMENLPTDLNQWPLGIGGKDPRIHASKALGEEIVQTQLKRMTGLLLQTLDEIQ